MAAGHSPKVRQHGSGNNNNSNNNNNGMTDNQKQAIVLLVLSAIIYIACQFDTTFSFLIPESATNGGRVDDNTIEGPKPDTNIVMIALLGERNSGTRWTSR
jgi:hypothetical protein